MAGNGRAGKHGRACGPAGRSLRSAGRAAQLYLRPYLRPAEPRQGETIAWAESNAVVFANSVLGARTDKTPDLLDACIALTGRAPLAGYYLDEARRARVVFELVDIDEPDDSFYPLLGYLLGQREPARVPVVTGMSKGWSRDALKAFGAALATTSSTGMFHVVGVTPEAETLQQALGGQEPEAHVRLTVQDLQEAWQELNPPQAGKIDLVALGNPHFSRSEFAALAARCAGRRATIPVVVTSSREIVAQAAEAGDLEVLQDFGAKVVTDTCWCMLQEPVIPPSASCIVTNSAKYAHYGPGLVRRTVCLANLQGCVDAAVDGHYAGQMPAWLNPPGS